MGRAEGPCCGARRSTRTPRGTTPVSHPDLRRRRLADTERAMSQENVDFVSGIFSATESMDKQALLAALPERLPQLCDPDVEWIEDPQRADARTYRGHEGVIESWRQWFETFGEYGVEVERNRLRRRRRVRCDA
jgi:hypothetical protein